MALRRRADRGANSLIWPGFVDAMTALLLVVMFVLSIFMILQFFLREELSGKDKTLQSLTAQLGALSDQLSIAQQESDFYQAENANLSSMLEAEQSRAAELASALQSQTAQLNQQQAALDDAEANTERLSKALAQRVVEIAALNQRLEEGGSETDRLRALVDTLTDERDQLRGLTASASALESANQELTAQVAALSADRDQTAQQLTNREAELLEREAALAALRKKLAETEERARQTELTLSEQLAAMELALDKRRQEAEETLLLLAAAEARREELAAETERLTAAAARATEAQDDSVAAAAQRAAEADRARTEADAARKAAASARSEASAAREEVAMLRRTVERNLGAAAEARQELSRRELASAYARAQLQAEREVSAGARQAVALLNAQIRRLRNELSGLRLQLDAADARDEENQVVIQNLGERLNRALAQKVGELQRYRSEFFGRMREVLGARDDIRVVGDRFVFQSEVLFGVGQAQLGPGGQAQLSRLAEAIRAIQNEIPADVDWMLRIDGHTDRQPIFGGRYRNNWELSQARALSVVEYLINQEGIPPDRLAATGFGEFQPLDPADTLAAYDRNRRIEMRLTER